MRIPQPSFRVMLLLMEEIQRSPVEVGSPAHYFQGWSYIPGGDRRISEPSTSITSLVPPEVSSSGFQPKFHCTKEPTNHKPKTWQTNSFSRFLYWEAVKKRRIHQEHSPTSVGTNYNPPPCFSHTAGCFCWIFWFKLVGAHHPYLVAHLLGIWVRIKWWNLLLKNAHRDQKPVNPSKEVTTHPYTTALLPRWNYERNPG